MNNYAQLLCDDLKKKRELCDKDSEDENCKKTLDMQLCRNGCGNCDEKENMTNVNGESSNWYNNKMYLSIILLLVVLVLLYLNREYIMSLVKK
jgi:hypothetical protein